MSVDYLTAFAATILAISLAAERLVTIAKSLFPRVFAEDPARGKEDLDPKSDRWRQLRVQLLAVAAAWLTASLLADGGFRPFGVVPIADHPMKAWVVGFLASGGSAFWTSVLGYAKAVKDTRQQERAANAAKAAPEQEAVARRAMVGNNTARRGRATAINALGAVAQPALRA